MSKIYLSKLGIKCRISFEIQTVEKLGQPWELFRILNMFL